MIESSSRANHPKPMAIIVFINGKVMSEVLAGPDAPKE